MARETLVSLEHEGGTARVFRDRHGVSLAGDEHGGTRIREGPGGRPMIEGVAPSGFVIGGLLPEGATRAIVVGPQGQQVEAVCANGAWIAVEPTSILLMNAPVRFETDAGEIVRPPLPASWQREPVRDAGEPCPACGAVEWERVTPADDSRGNHGGGKPLSVVACLRCGHEEDEGFWYALEADGESAPDTGPEVERSLEERHREQQELMRGLRLPVFALVDAPGPPTLGGWGHDIDRNQSVTVRHEGPDGAMIEIETADQSLAEGLAAEAARWALLGVLPSRSDLPDISQPARALWVAARERELRLRAATAEPFRVELAVDEEPVQFEGFRSGTSWAVRGIGGDVRITIAACDVAPERVRLRRLADPLSELEI